MEYLHVDPKLDDHPDVVDAGFAAATVFQTVLRVVALYDGHGVLRGKFASPKWLARRMNIHPDDIGGMNPEDWVDRALKRCLTCGLLKATGADQVIPGWENFYSPSKTNAQRQARFRQKQSTDGVTEVTPSNESNETPLRPVTPVTPSNGCNESNATQLNSTQQNRTKEEACAGNKPAPTPQADSEIATPAVALTEAHTTASQGGQPDAIEEPVPPEPDPADQLQALWNELRPAELPEWERTGSSRRRLAKEALKRRPLEGEHSWRAVMQRLAESSFCRGMQGSWKADPDWWLRPEGRKPEPAGKLLEGAYDDVPAAAARARANPDLTVGRSTFDWEAYLERTKKAAGEGAS